MVWFGKKRKPLAASSAPAPFAFRRRNVSQRHRVKVRHVQGYVVKEKQGNGVGEQVRSLVVVFCLSLLMGTMAVRLAYVAVMPAAEPRMSIRELPSEPLRRGDIYDRNGVLLATTLKTYSLYADPKRILDIDEVVARVPKVLEDVKPTRLREVLSNPNRRFVWIKRRMTPLEAQKIHEMGLPGLAFREEYVRVYPLGRMASHVLGAVDIDNKGLAGVERSYDKRLRTGEDLHLALDVTMQELLQESVREARRESDAKAAWGVVMDARTGEIPALVSLPDYDPNHFGKFPANARFNHAVLGSYEMGSTFKIFTLAQGIDNGKITPESLIDCREPIQIGRFTIRDFHAKKRILTATEVMRYSSNIGAARIAEMSGGAAQKEFLDRLGMLQPLDIGLAEVGPVKYPHNWGQVQTYTIAYGHGIMVTPLHLVAAVGALANDGLYHRPYVLKGGAPENEPKQVLSANTVRQVKTLMRDVVLAGSGRNSQVVGYDIGGKTGTAEKAVGGGYSHSKNIVSFVAALPMQDPRYITLVMLDEPKKGYETGGRSAAPAVGTFIRRLGLVEGIQPDLQLVAAHRETLEKNARWAQYKARKKAEEKRKAAAAAVKGEEGDRREAFRADTEHNGG